MSLLDRQVGTTSLAEELHDVSRWGEARLVHESLTSVIIAGPAEVPEAPEIHWLGAKLLNAQVLPLAGDRKGASGRATKLTSALQAGREVTQG